MRKYFREAWVEIDLRALRHNLNVIKSKLAKGTKILVAVKADAYGHGAREVTRVLEAEGVDYLGVATVDEGLILRKDGIKAPILVFGSPLPGELEGILEGDLIPTLSSLETAAVLDKKSAGHSFSVHLKIDTGMGRVGVWYEDALDFVKKLQRFKNIKIEGVYTHFASAAEEDASFTHLQIERFKGLCDRFDSEGIHIPCRHAANSMGVFRFPTSHFTLVRPGLAVYGLKYTKVLSGQEELLPVLTAKSSVALLKEIAAGRSVSYGRTFVAKKKTVIATIPIGYADGYPRVLSNRAELLVRGRRAPIVGNICMDQVMLDAGSIKGVQVGDEVVIVGKQGESAINIEELAELAHTVPHEIACSLGNSRLRRVYL